MSELTEEWPDEVLYDFYDVCWNHMDYPYHNHYVSFRTPDMGAGGRAASFWSVMRDQGITQMQEMVYISKLLLNYRTCSAFARTCTRFYGVREKYRLTKQFDLLYYYFMGNLKKRMQNYPINPTDDLTMTMYLITTERDLLE